MTAQVRDILIYNEEQLYMAAEPLYDYLKETKLPYELVAPSTACWRGYTSKWSIDNKKLFLLEWQGYILDYQEVGMEYLFPNDEIVFAKWFTGEIRIGMGNTIDYIHGGYASVHEGDMFLIFENGMLIKEYVKWLTQEEIKKIIKEDEDLPF
jgi:hypothetical protein